MKTAVITGASKWLGRTMPPLWDEEGWQASFVAHLHIHGPFCAMHF